ncbi:hypothetical protein TNCV_2976721 [Trichonephila clavipes]|nr:hypothetical protein TNCV_2976721 [Trichonephila clavipes]
MQVGFTMAQSSPVGVVRQFGVGVPVQVSSKSLERVMSRRKQRSAFDQVPEFDRGRIVAYRDCGLSFREIGSRVG